MHAGPWGLDTCCAWHQHGLPVKVGASFKPTTAARDLHVLIQGKLEQLEATRKGMEDVLRTHWDTRAGLEENADRLQADIGRLEADLAAQTARSGAPTACASGQAALSACRTSCSGSAAEHLQLPVCTLVCAGAGIASCCSHAWACAVGLCYEKILHRPAAAGQVSGAL